MIIAETRPFQRVRDIYFTESEFGELTYALFYEPKLGVVIPGTGGVRKLRWKSQGRGKRGGLRVMYYVEFSNETIYLLTAYAKSGTSDLPRQLLNKMRRMIENDDEE
jgi:hypothetical protein